MDERKMLEFAYKMRDIYEKNILVDFDPGQISYMRERASKGEWKNALMYPEYGEIYDVILDLEDAIKYKEAKSMGRGGEKSRTAAAKKIIGMTSEGHKNLMGYKDNGDGTVTICNGYCIFTGDGVIGINEVPEPNTYPDFTRQWPDDYGYKECHLTSDDITDIKNRLAEGKAVTGYRNPVDINRAGSNLGLFICGNERNYSAFNADYVLNGVKLLGGNEWILKFYGGNKPSIIEGDHGKFLMLPVHMAKAPERLDKEVA